MWCRPSFGVRASLAFLVLTLVTGCGEGSPDSQPADAPSLGVDLPEPEGADPDEVMERVTLADFEIEAPGRVEDRIPFPSTASIQNEATPGEGLLTVAFDPRAVFSEAAQFFKEAVADSDWAVDSEIIGRSEAGEVGADWRLSGHGVRVSISLIGFEGASSDRVRGSLIVMVDDR